jgi:hypothetical protein
MEIGLKKISRQFLPGDECEITAISSGLINSTYKVVSGNGDFILQKINTAVFNSPQQLQQNYRYVSQQLTLAGSRFRLAEMICTVDNKDFLGDEHSGVWRMFSFVKNSFVIDKVQSPEHVYEVAVSFSRLTLDLAGADSSKIKETIPGFHDLSFRHRQLLLAIGQNKVAKLKEAEKVLEGLEAFKPLLSFYEKLSSQSQSFRKYVLHHDAKISNILFDKDNHTVLTPVDMDTVMPGFFFSDAGDMFRSMAGSADENDTAYNDIHVNKINYEAITDGYLSNMAGIFTKEENSAFHLTGPLLLYMQCARFVTDFLNGDIYYSTTHRGQNLERAMNQLALLRQLYSFVKAGYGVRL